MKRIILCILTVMLFAGCSAEVNELSYKQISTEDAMRRRLTLLRMKNMIE